MASDLICSLQILLPDALQRNLAQWTEQTPGTSWPQWGGHVTVVPRFRTALTLQALSDYVAAVCRKQKPFTLCLNAPLAVADRTRQDYYAVFLATGEEPESGSASAAALRQELIAALGPYRQDLVPEVTERPFLPHITLALGLSEREASRVVRAGIAAGLAAEFTVEEVTLIFQPDSADADSAEQIAFSLGGGREG